MAQIIVITHGNLASELIRIAESILGRQTGAVSICLDLHEEDRAEIKNRIKNALAPYPNSNLIILTDLFGGTASNLAIPFVRKERTEVITGLNLAMLLYLLTQPADAKFREMCQGAKQAAQEAIVIAGEYLP